MKTPENNGSYGEVIWQANNLPQAGRKLYDVTGQISRSQFVDKDETQLFTVVTDLGAETGAYTFRQPQQVEVEINPEDNVSTEGILTRFGKNNKRWNGGFLQSPAAVYADSFSQRSLAPPTETGNKISAFAANTYFNEPRDGEIGPVEYLRRRRKNQERVEALGCIASQPAVEKNEPSSVKFNDDNVEAQEALMDDYSLSDAELLRLLDGLKTLDDKKSSPEQPDSRQESNPLFDELLANSNLADLLT